MVDVFSKANVEESAQAIYVQTPDFERCRVVMCVHVIHSKPQNKKADMAEHPEVFDHVGLLINQPLGHRRPAKLLFI